MECVSGFTCTFTGSINRIQINGLQTGVILCCILLTAHVITPLQRQYKMYTCSKINSAGVPGVIKKIFSAKLNRR